MAQAKESHLKDFSRHTEELRNTANHLGEDVRKFGRATSNLAHDTMDMLNENAGRYYRRGVQKAQEWEGSVEEQIRRRPMRSIAIAAAVGLILGAVWKRR